MDGTVTVEIAWAKMVLIPKCKGDYRGIGLVEVLCKVCPVVVNCRLKNSDMIHDALHGFRIGRGTGMATLGAKLDQKLVGLVQEPLFHVFLDVRKAHDLLDRKLCLELLRGYRPGPNLARIF